MESRPLPVCPRCGAARILAPECPQCGVIYARAEALAQRKRAVPAPEVVPAPEAVAVPETVAPAAEVLEPLYIAPYEPERPPHLPPETGTWHGHAEDARREYLIRLYALPAALLVAWGLVSTYMGQKLIHIFFSMWLHEFGHAISAWLCGFKAFPGPWQTSVSPSRSMLFALLVAAGIGFMMWRAWREEYWPVVIGGGAVLALQFLGTVVLSHHGAQQLIYFGGDAGALVLGSVMMATLYAPRDSRLHEGWSRWGFLVIGACAFVHRFTTWLKAREDFGTIAFGANHGSGASDPSMLADVYRWPVNVLVHRYIDLGIACLTVLAVLYLVGLLRARAEARAAAAA